MGNQASLSWFLVELLVFEEMTVESSEGTVKEEELVVSSISGIRPSLAFISLFFLFLLLLLFLPLNKEKKGKNPANCDL